MNGERSIMNTAALDCERPETWFDEETFRYRCRNCDWRTEIVPVEHRSVASGGAVHHG